MVIKIIDTDENGKPVEILADSENLMLFGTIPETDEQDRQRNSTE